MYYLVFGNLYSSNAQIQSRVYVSNAKGVQHEIKIELASKV